MLDSAYCNGLDFPPFPSSAKEETNELDGWCQVYVVEPCEMKSAHQTIHDGEEAEEANGLLHCTQSAASNTATQHALSLDRNKRVRETHTSGSNDQRVECTLLLSALSTGYRPTEGIHEESRREEDSFHSKGRAYVHPIPKGNENHTPIHTKAKQHPRPLTALSSKGEERTRCSEPHECCLNRSTHT